MTPVQIRFARDMRCCRSARSELGLACAQPRQLCCAWWHVERIAHAKGLPVLKEFAEHLLGFWPLCDVFYAFAAGKQMSALALACVERWLQMPDDEARAAYRSQVVVATQVYRTECGPDNPAAFVATFDVLCGAAQQRR
ncbi:hypothetical protein CURE108131_25055 [Cupriavidus respiraculi]|uniref:Uncharacterized protein n=1 Tax=Cupriavidus respiraculi TaxID=195930 RepID=A0ABM8XV01_9BURK|nr:hypothetical protein [Cupriavidus respiraculi]CAG9184217.1 hypothetical protein LMG21510_05042 [Cupriavidus respiraculi]